MKLSKILSEFPLPYQAEAGDAEISGICSDSRQVQPGDLFVAMAGGTTDGHRFIPAALERGAAAVVGTQIVAGLAAPYVRVDDARQALPHLAAAFNDYPGRKLTVIGVTGTDGKTTTTNLVHAILQAEGHPTGMISTINAVIGERVLDTGFHVTTPDAPEIQHHLAEMVAAGLTHVVLEVTSHGLAQYRADACEFDVGVVTNITHEHLDYHGSYEAYRAAKGRLFSGLSSTATKPQGNPRTAVLNRDDASYDYLAGITRVDQLSYGFDLSAEVQPKMLKQTADGLSFTVSGKGRQFSCHSQLLGEFNVSNCLAAISATVFALDVSPEAAQQGLATLKSVPGRMESINLGQDFTAMVDFAHTPNALQVALKTARQLTRGRVIAVFGAAGLRDRQKRRMMADTSLRYADLTVLTAEDPRTEQLEDILAEMAAGAVLAGGVEGQSFWRVPDRGEAIRFAVSMAKAGDIVIACGKGHEQSMCFGETEYPWDDRIAMRAALSELLHIPGTKMPFLPTQPG